MRDADCRCGDLRQKIRIPLSPIMRQTGESGRLVEKEILVQRKNTCGEWNTCGEEERPHSLSFFLFPFSAFLLISSLPVKVCFSLHILSLLSLLSTYSSSPYSLHIFVLGMTHETSFFFLPHST